MTLIAEDLLLVLLDERGALTSSSSTQPLLGGALLVELALLEAVVVEERSSRWRDPQVHATGAVRPGDPVPADPVLADPVLAEALDVVARKPRTAEALVSRIGSGRKEALLERLEQRGTVRRHRALALGLLPTTRWLVTDQARREDLRRALGAVLVEGAQPDPRTGALVALLLAVGRAHKVVDRQGVPASVVKRRAADVADGAWAADAVKDAIASSVTAVAAAVAVAGAAGAAGS